MNKIFKSIWNQTTKTWVAVSEISSAQKKCSAQKSVSLNTCSSSNGKSTMAPSQGFPCYPTAGRWAAGTIFAALLTAVPSEKAFAQWSCNEAWSTTGNGKISNCSVAGQGIAIVANNDSAATGEDMVLKGGGGSGQAVREFFRGNADNANQSNIWIGDKAYTNSITTIYANSFIVGNAATTAIAGSMAMGNNAVASGTSSLSFGTSAIANIANSVALGSNSVTYTPSSIASALIGGRTYSSFAGTTSAGVVSVGSTSATRQVQNVSAGTIDASSTDAVNGSQLYSVAQNTNTEIDALNLRTSAAESNITNLDGRVTANEGAVTNLDSRVTVNEGSITDLGGRVTVNEGSITSLDSRTTVNEGSITNLQSSVTNLSTQINSGEVGLVQQDSTLRTITVAKDRDGNLVDFSGLNGARRLTGVAQGEVSQTSTDAINGAQLFDTKQTITDLDGRVTVNEGSIVNLESSVTDLTSQISNGEVGLVQQEATTRSITVAKNKDGQLIDFSGTQGERVLTGVADGLINPFSTQAINGRQVFAISQSMAAAIGGGAAVDNNGTISAPSYSVGGTTVNNIGGAISNLDTRMGNVESTVTQLTGQLSQNGGNLIKQDQTSRDITLAADTDGTRVNIAGTAGERTLSGVADGNVSAGSTDAINGGQLYDVSLRMTQMEQNLNDGVAVNMDYVQTDGKRDGSDRAKVTTGSNGTAIGANANVSASNGVAVGANATAKAENSVALGANSVADRANSVSVGSAGHERVITHVADPVEATDAVNKRSMDAAIAQNNQHFDQRISRVENTVNDVARKAYGGVAAATAMTMIPDVDSGKRFAVGIGTSTFQGYGAAAVGVSVRLGPNTKAKFGAGFSSAGSTVGGGVAFQW